MPRRFKVVVPLVVALLVAGCGVFQSEQGLVVHPDGTAELVRTVLLPEPLVEELAADGGPWLDARQVQEMAQEEFPEGEVEVEEVEDGDWAGYRVRVRFRRLDDAIGTLTAATPVEIAPGRTVTVPDMFSSVTVDRQEGLLKTRYVFEARLETPFMDVMDEVSRIVAEELSRSLAALDSDPSLGDPSPFQLPADDPDLRQVMRIIAATLDLRFSVSLPGRVDPDSIRGPGRHEIGDDGRTVTWRLPLTQPITLSAAFDASPLAGLSLTGWVRRTSAAIRPVARFQGEWGLPLAVGLTTAVILSTVAWRLGWWRDGPR